jgi:hypothetical protein
MEVRMSEERRKILDMLAEGKITVEEAEKLLAAISDDTEYFKSKTEKDDTGKSGFKFLRIQVEPGPGSEKQERVNIRVPTKLIRAGLKWAALMPKHARTHVHEALHEKGIEMDFDKMSAADIEELVAHLDDLTVDVEGKEKVRIYCE